MASLHVLEARLRAVEARLAEVEGGYGTTLYQLRRHAVRTDITLQRISSKLGVLPATDAEVDAALDEEA